MDISADLGPVPGLGYAQPVSRHPSLRLDDTGLHVEEATVAEEVPVAFVYGGRSYVVVMATPADLEDLAVGFTVTERIVERAADIGRIEVVRHSRGIELQIDVPAEAAERLAARSRAMNARTGCGLCGIEAIDEVLHAPPPVLAEDATFTISRGALVELGALLEDHQPLNAETRTMHAAGWMSNDRPRFIAREDVGRHNALDKVVGAVLREGLDPARGMLVVTSRASYELVLKTAVVRVPLLAAVSRPTSLAIRLAEQTRVMLVGLLRGRSANVYTERGVPSPARAT